MTERLLRRSVTMAFGFLVAAGAGAAFLPVAALTDPALREVGAEAALGGVFAFVASARSGIDPTSGLVAFVEFFWAATIAVCVAPLAIVALIGEVAGQRGWLLHAAGCGFLAAAAPWIARVASASTRAYAATPLELRIAALFFLVGVLTGTVYWLIAARRLPSTAVTPATRRF